jgi:hypothetical protein
MCDDNFCSGQSAWRWSELELLALLLSMLLSLLMSPDVFEAAKERVYLCNV